MYLALSYEPERQEEQPEPQADANDREQAGEMLEDQAQEEAADAGRRT
jgi:hypothetical protein